MTLIYSNSKGTKQKGSTSLFQDFRGAKELDIT